MDRKKPDIKKKGISQILSRFRSLIQAAATLLTNIHLPNFLKGGIYQGKGKAVCVPGLNCYSCPAASGACPIGSFQAVVGSSKFAFSYYITGFLILLGVLLGRFICGFLCPFGWFQELLHKIPTRKISTKKLKGLTYIKYAVLLITVVLLPALAVNDIGMGDPFFCKYICPQGVLEGAIPLAAVDSGLRAALGSLFSWKLGILTVTIVLSVLFICAAVLIIYYKQLCEGYEDQPRFAIMQKVGMTAADIRRSVNSQLLTVFFLPMAGAALHMAFAFPMIRRMLLLFELHNTGLFIATALVSFAVLAVVYTLVYKATSNAYYRIVKGSV